MEGSEAGLLAREIPRSSSIGWLRPTRKKMGSSATGGRGSQWLLTGLGCLTFPRPFFWPESQGCKEPGWACSSCRAKIVPPTRRPSAVKSITAGPIFCDIPSHPVVNIDCATDFSRFTQLIPRNHACISFGKQSPSPAIVVRTKQRIPHGRPPSKFRSKFKLKLQVHQGQLVDYQHGGREYQLWHSCQWCIARQQPNSCATPSGRCEPYRR